MNQRLQARFGKFFVDSDSGATFEGGRVIKFQSKELAVLIELLRRPGELVSKEELIEKVWGDASTSDSSLARCISGIKSQLKRTELGAERRIKTIYGKGYSFAGEVFRKSTFVCEESIQSLIDASPDVIALKDHEGRWLVINRAGIQLYRLQHIDWLGKTDSELAEICLPYSRPIFESSLASDLNAWNARTSIRATETMELPDGSTRVVNFVRSPLYNKNGTRKSLVIVGHDITELVQLTERNKLASQTISNSSEAVVITNAQNQIVTVNKAFVRITGYEENEVLGHNPRVLASGRHDKAFYKVMWDKLKAEGIWRGEIWDRRKNGEIYPKWIDISTVHNTDGKITNYIAIFSDLTRHKEIEEKIHFLAYHDPLTKLPNRQLLSDRFERAAATANRDSALIALLFIDMDGFKTVNDSLGHDAGDRLLVTVAERLERCVRDADTVARIGGDEFVVLLTDLRDVKNISAVAEKILASLMKPHRINGIEVGTAASIGIAVFPEDGQDFDTVMKMADTSMYHAKNCGKNTYRFFTEKMNVDANERVKLKTALRRALTQSEFSLHYQPQFDLASSSLIGVEALLRWNSKNMGAVLPAKFIPVAEDCGLIVEISEWVLAEACRQNKSWQEAGFPPLRVAVNLSVLQFLRGNITQTVRNVLKATHLDPQYLELELTESVLVQNAGDMFSVLEELKEIGVHLSIDDFGTGYFSLAYLKNLPIDKLKIDQSFIRNMTIDSNDHAIVHSIIQLAHSLKLRVVAEGIETENQVALLRSEGCDQAQGYFLGYPMPGPEIERCLFYARAANKIR